MWVLATLEKPPSAQARHRVGLSCINQPQAQQALLLLLATCWGWLQCPWWLWPTVAALKRRQMQWQQKGHKENPVLVLSVRYFGEEQQPGGVLWVS